MSGSTGRHAFVERAGLASAERDHRCRELLKRVAADGIEAVRLSFVDQHGILRGKTLVASELAGALANGCSMTSTLLSKDTAHRTVFAAFTEDGGLGMAEMAGAADFLMVPEPASFRVLPWLDKTGWLLCDIYFPTGRPVPFSTRALLARALDDLAARGFDYVSGLEVEFHIFEIDDDKLDPADATMPGAPPAVRLIAQGYQYLTEARGDEHEPIMTALRRTLQALDLPIRSLEVEFGPSQVEITLAPGKGLETADAMVLFRSAVKQVCRRHGLLASFMCRPALPNLLSSGWHLHQSLVSRDTGANAFMPEKEGPLSPLGMGFLAGLLEHASAASVFTTPTINGYKRYRPMSLAPDRINWGIDNKGAMLRVTGGPGDPGSRIENRVGEPAANPYLYLASQIVAGLDGVDRKLAPPPPAGAPYATPAPKLPASLMDAVAALRGSALYRQAFGDRFVDYLAGIKEAEISRFLSEVTDWEQREYFALF
jgi:glutamine synthetase